MDRKTERGQMMIEMALLVLMFAGFFLAAVTITQEGERKQSEYRFQSKSKAKHWKNR